MFDDIPSETILILLLATALYFWFFWLIIRSANHSTTIRNLMRTQVEILKEIAIQNGVDPARVADIIARNNQIN